MKYQKNTKDNNWYIFVTIQQNNKKQMQQLQLFIFVAGFIVFTILHFPPLTVLVCTHLTTGLEPNM